jgi:hypothetical protein
MIYCKQPIGETTAWFKMPSKQSPEAVLEQTCGYGLEV